jgi:MoaA/NifB/PqqE/SkfB family radical SAM enzyme
LNTEELGNQEKIFRVSNVVLKQGEPRDTYFMAFKLQKKQELNEEYIMACLSKTCVPTDLNNIKKKLIQDIRYKDGIEKCLEKPDIMIAPTNYCNFSCEYCSTKNYKNKMKNIDVDLVKHIVDQCIFNGWNFSFGQTYEPFLHPKINEIIAYVREKGRLFSSPTNAFSINKEAYSLPMNLLISYSANNNDYILRNFKVSYDIYQKKIIEFVRYRIENNIQGAIALQIADYSIFKGKLVYDRCINEVDQILQKTKEFMKNIGLIGCLDELDCRNKIMQRTPITLYESGCTIVKVQPTKIMPNTYEAFTEMPEITEKIGYCDSCFTMMSIQSNGDVGICCCDPTAKVIAGKIDTKTNIKDFWLGNEMQNIRNHFVKFSPKHNYCVKCLYSVSENIKPLLSVKRKEVVSNILRDNGVKKDLAWFKF